MSLSVFEKQDLFLSKMQEDYDNGSYVELLTLAPYFDWKYGNAPMESISSAVAHYLQAQIGEMLENYYSKYPQAYKHLDSAVNDDPWQIYRGFGCDTYIVSYLETVDADLFHFLDC